MLVWSALTLLAAVALALAIVLASLAVVPADPAPPPPTSPMQSARRWVTPGRIERHRVRRPRSTAHVGGSGLIGAVDGRDKERDREAPMALFMDVHTINGGVSLEDVATAHMADLAIQGGHGVRYLRHWVDERDGKVFCWWRRPRMRLPPSPTARRMESVKNEAGSPSSTVARRAWGGWLCLQDQATRHDLAALLFSAADDPLAALRCSLLQVRRALTGLAGRSAV